MSLDHNRPLRFPVSGGQGYSWHVTLSTRRRSYWFLFVLSVLILGAAVVMSLPYLSKGAHSDPAVLSWSAFGISFESRQLAALGAILLSAFSTSLLFAILVSFRKTASEEIFFLAFWALSCSFESGRILVARLYDAGAPPSWMSFVTHVVLAARFGGYGAFFFAGLRSAGFRNERPGRAVMAAIGVGIAAASALPLDSGTFEPTNLIRSAYPVERLLLVAALALITAANLLVAVETTGERVFRTVAVGAVALLVGQALLVSGWHPEILVAGVALLVVGARLYVSRLHSHYLWQ